MSGKLKHIEKGDFTTMRMKYVACLNQEMAKITEETLVVGIDIAKIFQWARFVDYRGIEHNKAFKFKNRKSGFEAILAKIGQICKTEGFIKVIVGMEPTGHYWKPLANWMAKKDAVTVVLVNPYATKRAKELDDNSPTKSDKKDALTIAKLVKDGRYFHLYLPHDIYAELRTLTTTRTGLVKRINALKNTIVAVMDEYFPEYTDVFKCPLKGKASRHILKVCPFPCFIIELGEEGLVLEIRKAVKKSVGRKKALQLLEAAKGSIGVDYGEAATKQKLLLLIEELELVEKQILVLEEQMAEAMRQTDYAEYLLSIKGIGVVSLAMCLGELGDPTRFEDARQMSRMAGYNLIEDSSGKNKMEPKSPKGVERTCGACCTI